MSKFYCLPSGVARAGNNLIIIQETTAWQVSWKQDKELMNKTRDYPSLCTLPCLFCCFHLSWRWSKNNHISLKYKHRRSLYIGTSNSKSTKTKMSVTVENKLKQLHQTGSMLFWKYLTDFFLVLSEERRRKREQWGKSVESTGQAGERFR